MAGRFCNGLMTAFRGIQIILSLAVVGCGAFVIYNMYSMSSAAHNIETSLLSLINNSTKLATIEADLHMSAEEAQDVQDSLKIVNDALKPILQIFEGTPVRAIILTAVGVWSIAMITYLLVAQRSTQHVKMNTRSIRITLELFTLLLWIVGIVCAALLACEYGAIIFTGGAELKVAWAVIRKVVAKALEEYVSGDELSRELGIVNDLFNIGALSILAIVAAGICGCVSFVSLIAACCISGKQKQKTSTRDAEAAEYMVAPMSAVKPGFTISVNSSPSSSALPTPMYRAVTPQVYSPVPQDSSYFGRGE